MNEPAKGEADRAIREGEEAVGIARDACESIEEHNPERRALLVTLRVAMLREAGAGLRSAADGLNRAIVMVEEDAASIEEQAAHEATLIEAWKAVKEACGPGASQEAVEEAWLIVLGELFPARSPATFTTDDWAAIRDRAAECLASAYGPRDEAAEDDGAGGSTSKEQSDDN